MNNYCWKGDCDTPEEQALSGLGANEETGPWLPYLAVGALVFWLVWRSAK